MRCASALQVAFADCGDAVGAALDVQPHAARTDLAGARPAVLKTGYRDHPGAGPTFGATPLQHRPAVGGRCGLPPGHRGEPADAVACCATGQSPLTLVSRAVVGGPGGHADGHCSAAEPDSTPYPPPVRPSAISWACMPAPLPNSPLAGSFPVRCFMSVETAGQCRQSIMGVMMLATGMGTEVKSRPSAAGQEARCAARADRRQVRRGSIAPVSTGCGLVPAMRAGADVVIELLPEKDDVFRPRTRVAGASLSAGPCWWPRRRWMWRTISSSPAM